MEAIKHNNKPLPEPYKDIMITYEKTIYFGHYNMNEKKEIITKRGFYDDLFNTFSVPPQYRYFNNVYLPHGFGGDHLSIDKIINWKYCNDNK